MDSAIGLILNIIRTLIVVGVIIFVHELGHFLAAKKLGIIVERFSIGFGPKLFGFIRGDTEYRISVFPIFGGYVKMKGEYLSDDKDEEGELEEGHFLAAPVSHRAIVAISGPGMNLILAVVVIALAYMVGMPSQLVPNKNLTVGYVKADSPASKAGVMPGDKIVAVAGYGIKTWSDVQENIVINPDKEVAVTLLRDGQEINTKIIPERIEELILSIGAEPQSSLDNGNLSEGMRQDFENNKVSLSPNADVLIKEPGSEWLITDGNREYHVKKEHNRLNIYRDTEYGEIGIAAVSKPTIGGVEEGSEAAKSGFRPGDVIEEINGKKVGHIIEFLDELPTTPGEPAKLTINRNGDELEIPLPMVFDENNQLVSLGGISFGKMVRLNPISAFGVAIPETIRTGGKIFQFLKRMIIREVPMKYVAGPIGIVQLTMAIVKTGLAGTLHFAGFLSVNLGIVNLLPLFITDGGMIVFLIIEKIRGKRLSRRKQLIIQQIGVAFIILLFLAVTYNDVLRIVRGSF